MGGINSDHCQRHNEMNDEETYNIQMRINGTVLMKHAYKFSDVVKFCSELLCIYYVHDVDGYIYVISCIYGNLIVYHAK